MADPGVLDGVGSIVRDWTWPLCILGGGVVASFVIEKVVHARLLLWAERTTWPGDDVVVRASRGVPLVWLSLLSAYVAAGTAPISPEARDLIRGGVWLWVMLSATVFAARTLSGFFVLFASRLPGFGSSSIFSYIITAFIYALGMLVILQTLGVSVTPILGALGVGGLAVALALQDTLSNLFAGIHIIISRHVRPGDYVRMDTGDEGQVADIGWRNTTVRSPMNNLVVVPNSKLAGAVVTNYSLPEKQLVMKIPIGVGYASDLAQVERVTLEVARAVLEGMPPSGPLEPAVRFHTFGDSSINAEVTLPVGDFSEQALIRHRFVMQLHERFRQEGIEIPYPVRTVHLVGGAAPVVSGTAPVVGPGPAGAPADAG
ncbi:MAG: mechanosensitive ion channel family protein [Planctomycetes bacterium]|nr:mechanosensitive ion channel family protein [Planctomycetota bacterium]